MRLASPLDAIIAHLGFELLPRTRARLLEFGDLVWSWNRKMNLVGAKEPAAFADVLFVDALVVAKGPWLPSGATVVDVGAGAGAPAIPLLLVRDDLTLTLVEPLRKRVAFLRNAVGRLGLEERATVVGRRMEAGDESLGAFDVAMSRATFAPDEWIRRAATLAPRALAFGAYAELPDGQEDETSYVLPSSGAPRVLRRYGAQPSISRPS